jgi:hypothetical protein
MRFLRGSGVHGAKLFFQDLGFYFNLSLYMTTIQAYLHFFQDHFSRKGKPSAKAHKEVILRGLEKELGRSNLLISRAHLRDF